MGYRIYFSAVPTVIIDKLKTATTEADVEKVMRDYMEQQPNGKDADVYASPSWFTKFPHMEIGKYYEHTGDILNPENTLPVLHNEDTECYYTTPDTLKKAAEIIRLKIVENIQKDMTDPEMQERANKDRLMWLDGKFVFDWKPKSLEVSGSWLYEHSIFNYVSFYKMVDWSKNTLIVSGW